MAVLHLGDKRFALPDGGELVIGRHRDCGIQIADGKSSRRHARVFVREGGWWVEDLASANGTRLNSGELPAPRRLTDGDRIVIGEVSIRFDADGAAAAVPVAAGAAPAVAPPPPAPAPVDGDAPAALVGCELGGYRIDKHVARALTGDLYRVTDLAQRRPAMLKVLDRRLLADGEFPARFQRQLALAAGIEHPAVVRLYRCGHDHGRLWYAMELVDGMTLAQRLQDPVRIEEALAIAIALGEALQAYHETGLVHGDVKPASVALQRGEGLRLLDIGLIGLDNDESRMLQAEGSTRQVFYLCPAQARGGQCNTRSDIYSLGCILHHLLTGRPPYVGTSYDDVVRAHETQPVPKLAASLNLPMLLDECLDGMLTKDPFFRYDQVGFAIDALKQVRDTVA